MTGPRDLGLVIFDCDGVLVDSEPTSTRVLAESLTAAGLPTSSPQALADYKGLTLADVISRAQAKLGRSLPDGWLESYERERAEAFRRDLEPVPGAAEAVAAVRTAGVPVCVASQGRLEKTRLTLGLTGLLGLFAEGSLFSSYSVPRGKPHPDLFLHAAGEMGVPPARCVVVEDTPIGAAGAIAAGMRVLGLARGLDERERAEMKRIGAEPFDALAELPPLLGIAAGGSPIETRSATHGSRV